MSAELLPVWQKIQRYINEGISVIPVRDRDEGEFVAKSPYGKSWKEFQNRIIGQEELFELMDVKYNTTAIGLVGGAVSGNLEIIDIDIKYKPGIDAVIFITLQTLYPDLFSKLRIHKTPSGGYHMLYRCEVLIPGNQKLAGRPATDEELAARPKTKVYNFIETRGEGGYVLGPPSLNYEIIQDRPLPVLTGNERESIVSILKSFNEIIKIEPAYKPIQQDNQYYDTNPFEDFNNRCNPDDLMKSLGWEPVDRRSNHFIWYTRPGKTKGISISFNLQKRFFYCFTASTELEESKGYTPANLLAAIQFNGDKKALYRHLVQNGFGVIKPAVEASVIRRAAINRDSLPANISQSGVNSFHDLTVQMEQTHPYGTFWIDSAERGIVIDRKSLYSVIEGLGFRLLNGNLVKIDDGYIEQTTDRFFFDSLRDYIKENDANLYRDIFNALEVFIEKHGKFTITRLPLLPDHFILKDTVDTSYKCYQNVIVRITADGIDYLQSVPQLIWKHSIQPRDFNNGETGRYIEFLRLATDFDRNREYLMNIIGFLAHEYKDETAGYIIVLTEQCENPKEGGGAGKNIFSELFKKITSFVSKPGSQVKYDEKFMQSWNGQKIFCLSDVPKSFNFSFLKELSTGTGLQKKLFKDESEIPSEMMPKFLIQTNYSYEVSDGGLKRRIKGVEFTDFFTRMGGVDVFFGVHFPKGWNAEDWAGYDTLMALSVQSWLLNGRKIQSAALSNTGWLKQFEQTYGQVIYNFIKENFNEWKRDEWVSNELFKDQLDKYYRDNNTLPMYRPSSIKVNAAIKEYASHNNIDYKTDPQKRVNGVMTRHRWFGSEGRTPF